MTKLDPKLTKKRMMKIKNWSIWQDIVNIKEKKKLNIKFKKIKAHVGNKYNEKAD
jgi:ribonuclease HI